MWEDCWRQNDEFQFETYYANTIKSGDTYKGEWTVYHKSTFLNVATSKDDGDKISKFQKDCEQW